MIKAIRYAQKSDFTEISQNSEFLYYDWDFLETVSQALNCRNISLRVDSKQGTMFIPLMEKRVFHIYPVGLSIPFGLYGGISGDVPLTCAMYADIIRQAKRFLHMDIILQNPFQESILSQTPMSKVFDTAAYIVNIENRSHDEFFHKIYEHKMRKNIKRAGVNNVAVKSGNDADLMKQFYDLYVLTNLRWGKQAPRYGQIFFDNFCDKDFTEIFIAYLNEKPSAGLFMLKFRNYYFGWYGAMDKETSKYRTNDYLHDHVIKTAIQNKFRMVNFGASDGLEGVKQFKKSFGANPVPYHIYFTGNIFSKLGLKYFLNKRN
jgi:hypothetical protein